MSDLVIMERQDMTSLADAIRSKTGETKDLTLGDMIGSVGSISSNGLDTSDADATSEDIANGKTAYVDGEKITGTFTIDDEITTQDNLITQIQTALEGKTANTGIDTSDATAAAEDIAIGKTAYVDGNKVVGTHECEEGLDTSDATAIASDIVKDKTAYVNGVKLVGTHECSSGESGGSINTCTLSCWNDLMSGTMKIRFIASVWDSMQNKVMVSNTGDMSKMSNEILTNVICGSLVLVVAIDGTFGTTTHNFYIGDDVTESPVATTYHYFTVPNNPDTEINVMFGL